MKMRKNDSSRSIFINVGVALAFLLLYALAVQAQTDRTRNARGNSELATARYFESIRKSPPQMMAFLRRMPKGADLHSHLSGAIYAESYLQWAAEEGLCVNQSTTVLSQPPCDQASGQLPVSTALSNQGLYRKLIDGWSMRNWQYTGNNGHDQFFDSFAKFGEAITGQTGKMLAEVVSRAASGRVLYLELMWTPDGGASSSMGQTVGWDGDFSGTLNKLKSSGIADAAAAGVKAIQEAEEEKNRLLKCGTPQADNGCSVTIRYIAQVSRASTLGRVYAQMVTGFALANDPNSKVVALNLVQPEDSLPSMQNFTVQMEMLNYLRPLYPKAHITLHAGELAPGIVPPEGLSFHIRDSVMKGHAERIGHGVAVMHEEDPYDLLKEMARRNVMVEICLTSNDTILGIRKEQHPLATYLQYGVPVALATDDEGVARSDISREYLKAAEEQGLGYSQLKRMARNSLQYAFLPGASLWADDRRFIRTTHCAKDIPSGSSISNACKQFLAGSEKARLQWKLEGEFKSFENQY
jgi:adenosine deaminase/adenosine deaminase CECR1